jgi:hypothetical protein
MIDDGLEFCTKNAMQCIGKVIIRFIIAKEELDKIVHLGRIHAFSKIPKFRVILKCANGANGANEAQMAQMLLKSANAFALGY